MEVFVWDERYLTGEPLIDEEHHALVCLINRVVALQRGAADAASIVQVLDELIAYAATHFAHEEQLMSSFACDERHVEKHKSVHHNFSCQVAQMRRQDEAALEPEFLLRFLSSWLAYHILGMDQSLSRQIRKIRSGMSPADAFEAEKAVVSDPATASLLAAMHGLYGVIVQRNDQLQAFNERLEETVAQRTADLQARNAQLLAANERLAQAQQQLLQAENLASLGRLAAGVAHEINNPISFVLSNLGVLGNYQRDLLRLIDHWAAHSAMPAELKSMADEFDLAYLREDAPVLLRESREGLERAKKIVQDLRDFSQVDQQQHRDWHSIAACAEASLALLGASLRPDIEVRRAFAELPAVWCSAACFNQALVAVLTNAIEAMPQGGVLTLRSGQAGEQVWLEVEDSGPGISEEILPRIFDPFYSTKRIGAGTGLGLAQAWGCLQQHQGRIEVRSRLGEGSVFRLVLPIKGKPQVAEV